MPFPYTFPFIFDDCHDLSGIKYTESQDTLYVNEGMDSLVFAEIVSLLKFGESQDTLKFTEAVYG